MITFLLLFWEFFKTGLFAIGGGMATLPFLNDIAEKYPWFTVSQLSDMIAISESTPGPIGVNMATYAGYTTGYAEFGFIGGIIGALVATVGLVLPSLVIIIIVAGFLNKFKNSPLVTDAFYALRPAVTALIAVAGLGILAQALLNLAAIGGNATVTSVLDYFKLIPIVVFVLIFIGQRVFKKVHPIAFIAAAAVLGIIFKL